MYINIIFMYTLLTTGALHFSLVCTTTIGDFDLPEDYSRLLPPYSEDISDDTSTIQIAPQLLELLTVDELKGSFTFSCFYRVFWNDTRLPYMNTSMKKFDPDTIPAEMFERLWIPSVVTKDIWSVEINGILVPTIYRGRLPPQRIFYSAYTSVQVGCPFKYHTYPLDVQICSIQISLMDVSNRSHRIEWFKMIGYHIDRKQMLLFQDLFQLKICEDTSDQSKATGHSHKKLILILERNYMSYMIQVYMPSVLFILIAWITILVPPTMLRTRLLLNSTNLLTMLTMFLAIGRTEATQVPKVSYLTALSIWMFVCVCFAFCSVLLVILDVRLITMLTQPPAKKSWLWRLLLPGKGELPDNDPTPMTSEADVTGEPSIENSVYIDEEGDEFVNASDVTPSGSADAGVSHSLNSVVRRQEDTWLGITASYEKVYMVFFPLAFFFFAISYMNFYYWWRRRAMEAMRSEMRLTEGLYPGCWCAPGDTWAGCLTDDQYKKNLGYIPD